MSKSDLDRSDDSTIKNLNKLRGSIKGRLTVFKNYINSFPSVEISFTQRAELKLRLQGARNLFCEFNDVQNKIECILPVSELESQLSVREEFENNYYSIIAKTECLINDEDPSSERSSSINSPFQSVKLPTISLPTFNGDYDQWLEFRDTYLALVHDSQEISDIQKFHYLKSSLRGSAQLVIDSVEFSARNYTIAWELLLSRYNNSRLLIHNHVKSLFSISNLKQESPSLIRKLIDTILKNIRALNLLGEPTEHWDTLIIYLVVNKLDSATEREWERYKTTLIPSTTDTDTAHKIKINNLITFLRNKADMLETLSTSHFKPGISQTSTSKRHSITSQTHSRLQCNVVTNKSKPRSNYVNSRTKSCLMCNAQHPLYSCEQFLNLNLHDKLTFIQNKQLCENCLHPGHIVSECRYGPCRKCDKKHNSLIHREGDGRGTEVRPVSLLLANEAGDRDCVQSFQPNAHLVNHSTSATTNTLHTHTHSQPVLLSTAIVETADGAGRYYKIRAVLDSGSERSFISQRLCNKLQLRLKQSTAQINGVGNVITKSTQNCDVQLRAYCGTFKRRISCLVLPHITSYLPTVSINKHKLNIPTHIQLADPNFHESQPVDMLIGADHFWDILEEGRLRLSSGPFLQNTKLGWVVSGPFYHGNRLSQAVTCNCSTLDTQAIDKQVRLFWELEELPSDRNSGGYRSESERQCEDHFVKTTTRVANGRFCVRIPFKQTPDVLGESYSQAKRRFLALEKRLHGNPTYKQLYHDFIHEYIQLGHMSRITAYSNLHYFMPHHGVFREHSTTTRLRVVFDASAATSNGISLNDLQLLGEPLQGDLISILLRFRENKYVACADIEKMYRQVLVDPEQRSLQLILWRDSPSEEIGVYQLNTVTYGTTSAPFLSCRCLKQLAHECDNPEVARVINNDFYVDDLICGEESIDKLLLLCEETAKTLNKGCFPLRKWIFSFDHGNYVTNNTVKELSLGEHTHSKTLGVGWHSKSDYLHFHTRFDNSNNATPTKRIILSVTSQIFDPIGLLSPAIILPKILLQKLWALKLNWDENVPRDIAQAWLSFANNLSILDSIKVPRYVFCVEAICCKELHIFTDASQVAYGACAYVRCLSEGSAVTVRLLSSKGKVAPLTPTTIPRLELCGARLGARLYFKLKESLRGHFDKVIFWTDSTIVLSWLRMSPNLLKTYVQNRVAEIHDLTKDNIWRHVKGRDNPADLISRGVHLDTLAKSTLWWNGPSFLHEPYYDSTYTNTDSDLVDLPEIKSNAVKILISNQITNDSLFTFSRFSQFGRMQRAAAYALRFIYNTRIKERRERRYGALTADELRESLLMLAHLSQREAYPDIYDIFIKKKSLRSTHQLTNLNIFLDNRNILRVGGRILSSNNFNFDKKHPILLSKNHHFTILLFRHEHKILLHAAPQLLLYSLREMWWPVGGRSLARTTVHNCVICARMRAKTLTPLMGNLPAERLQPGFPFMKCGVDYAGPVLILNRKGRGARMIKSYICLFICFVTRAIHLELVSDLSSDAYLLALKRFISRRGKPSEIFSDNGRNFVGLVNDFSKFLNSCSERIKDYVASQSIKFHFIPPYACHFGGFWEAGVKSCKHHLRRVVGNAHLTYEEFNTVLIQIEAVLNSRPISPLSPDPEDLQPLSPGHFLVGRSLTAPVSEDLTDMPAQLLTRYQRVEQMRQHFWTRWSKEYVSELQTRTKWKQTTSDLSQHTLVLIKDENLPPLKWSLGRIIKTFPGHDGISRVADIKTSAGIVRRAFSKICPLPVNEEEGWKAGCFQGREDV